MTFPLILKQVLIIFDNRVASISQYISLFIICFISSPIALNIGDFFLIPILISLYFLYVTILHLNKLFCNFKKIIIIFSIIILSNLFWIIPLGYSYKEVYGMGFVYASNFTNSLFDAPILKGFTLNEYYWFRMGTSSGSLYYPYSQWYALLSEVIIVSFLIFICFRLASTKIKREYLGKAGFFLFIFIIGVFLSKGTASPIGQIYSFLLRNSKYFGIYRASDLKFPYIVVIGLSYIISLALYGIEKGKSFKIKSKLKINYGIIVFIYFSICVVILGLPFINGSVIPDRQKDLSSIKITVPSYWQKYASTVSSDKLLGRILLFPKNFASEDNYFWGYSGTWFTDNLINQSSIGYKQSSGNSIQERNFDLDKIIYDFYEKNNKSAFLKSLSLFNIKSVLQRNDLDMSYGVSVDTIKNILRVYDKNKVIKFLSENLFNEKQFGQLISFKVPDKYLLPKFYIPNYIFFAKDRNLNTLESIISKDTFNVASAIYVNDKNNKILSNSLMTNNNNTIIEFKEVNPTKFRLIMHNVKGLTPLVFSESYSNQWKIYIENNNQTASGNIDIREIKSLYKITDQYSYQIDLNSLKDYVSRNLITTLGDYKEKKDELVIFDGLKQKVKSSGKYNIDFVSKNYYGTIQNNNLQNGFLWETWFNFQSANRQINKTHGEINGYANLWLIDPHKICSDKGLCAKNKDGSYDIQIIVDYYPQGFIYIGLILSILVSIGGVFYLVYKKVYDKKIL